ncbi:MAG: hypothetical protein PHV32_10430 [Eubacteriales bacterium]|nr:hypothetical protein [Eubacteriales bacterium]
MKKTLKKILKNIAVRNNGFGINEVLGIAAALIIAALVVIPGLNNFAGGLMGKLTEWWDTISSKIFLSSLPPG